MKLLTLNTHSLVEPSYESKNAYFVEAVSKLQPQIIALQEVNQSCSAAVVCEDGLLGYYRAAEGVVLRSDNHVMKVARALQERGLSYYWTWLPLKKGYEIYDEGIAVMSLSPITALKVHTISSIDDYSNWKTRKIIGIQTEATKDDWFYSVHFGWWVDEDPFAAQWARTQAQLSQKGRIWLMGDFNNPAQIREEGYDLIASSGFYDSYVLAKTKDEGITVDGVIDGWRDKMVGCDGMRIDQIWCSQKTEIARSQVIFNGKNKPVVSDHFGLIIETKEEL